MTQRLIFLRKMRDMEEARDNARSARSADGGAYRFVVQKTVKVTPERLTFIMNNLHMNHDELSEGLGGWVNEYTRRVVLLTDGTRNLHIDPSGFSYARYVGIPRYIDA